MKRFDGTSVTMGQPSVFARTARILSERGRHDCLLDAVDSRVVDVYHAIFRAALSPPPLARLTTENRPSVGGCARAWLCVFSIHERVTSAVSDRVLRTLDELYAVPASVGHSTTYERSALRGTTL